MKTEVIIATRKEPDLKATCDSIREHSDCSIRIMEDHAGMGPQFMRHAGIMQSDADVVIIMDGHMRVLPRRLDAAAEYIGARGHRVGCLKCYHSEDVDWSGTPYSGAKLISKTHWGDNKSKPQAMVGKWRTESTAGRIPCVMGACYIFRRDWYIDGLRAPWSQGTGWGFDEEVLSSATWLRGGEVELLPWGVWHRARKAGSQPFKYTQRQLDGIVANQLRILMMLPMPPERLAELWKHITDGTRRGEMQRRVAIADESAEWCHNYKQFLGAGGLSWDDFERKILDVETVKMPSMMEMREQAKAMGLVVPFGCKKVDLADMLAKSAKNGENVPDKDKKREKPTTGHEDDCDCGGCAGLGNKPPKTTRSRANWGANEYNNLKKRACVHCGENDSKIVGVRHVGRLTLRQRKCLACAKFFPTREENPK